MSTSKLQSLLFVLCLTIRAKSLQWTSAIKDDAVIFVCHGQDLVLPWNFTSTNENPYTVQWYYRGLSEELMATMAHVNFVPSPAFSGRVEFLPRAGIILKNIIPGDKGNYSVEVLSHFGTERQNSIVEISDAPSTSSGALDLQQDRMAVHNDKTGEWSVQLTCGHFRSLGQPPIDIVWTTPTGEMQQSTSYNGGNFHLILPNPVRGGNYTCAIAPQSPSASCLARSSPLLRTVVVIVDELVARLTLIESRQVDLLTGYLQLTETNANLTAYIHHLEDKDAKLTALATATTPATTPPTTPPTTPATTPPTTPAPRYDCPACSTPFDHETVQGGWTVIQRRCDGCERFNRTWAEYQNGFGNPAGEFWLGLDRLHSLTSSQAYEARFDLQTFDGKTGFAVYSNFTVGPSSSNYMLNFNNMTGGNLPDNISWNKGLPFSTVDVDHDTEYGGSCATELQSGWWFYDCTRFNPNGVYQATTTCPNVGCPYWSLWPGPAIFTALKTVQMMVRRP